jgi:hypothetical protein
MIKEKDILYMLPNFWVLRVKNGFEVLRSGTTHSTRCAQIGFKGAIGLNKAVAECDKRQKELDQCN